MMSYIVLPGSSFKITKMLGWCFQDNNEKYARQPLLGGNSNLSQYIHTPINKTQNIMMSSGNTPEGRLDRRKSLVRKGSVKMRKHLKRFGRGIGNTMKNNADDKKTSSRSCSEYSQFNEEQSSHYRSSSSQITRQLASSNSSCVFSRLVALCRRFTIISSLRRNSKKR